MPRKVLPRRRCHGRFLRRYPDARVFDISLESRSGETRKNVRLQQYFDHYLKGAPAPDCMQNGVPYIEKDKTALSALQAEQ
jgi:hypothetical protein